MIGASNNQLNTPYGIFVNQNGTIYIADSNNHRNMKWFPGATTGVLVAGNGAAGVGLTQLFYPMQIIVDSNEYMYICEYGNARIIRWEPNSAFGVCLVGCTGTSGNASTQLYNPYSFAFDSYGSLYVSDTNNNRVQKFQIFQYYSPSYKQPKFSSCATWNPNAITFASNGTVGLFPFGIYIDINNTIYVADNQNGRVLVWLEGSSIPTKNISGGLNEPRGIFVALNDDVYVANGNTNHRVDKWTSNATTSIIAMYVTDACYDLFISIDDNLYCSMSASHQVVKTSLNNGTNTSVIVAGNGTAGLSSYMLQQPRGLFVDMNFNFYVADCGNNRIQFFQSGQLNGTTITINGSNGPFTLDCPTDVLLDIDGYLFIVDDHNNRILGSGPTGFRCIVGCTSSGGSASNQLDKPHRLSFDSHGNLFVIDWGNSRLQKFFLSSNSCEETSTYAIQSKISAIFTTETTINTTSYRNVIQSSSSFFPTTCLPSTYIGSSCNISTLSCDILQPCLNNATCINNNNTALTDYTCSCPSGFNGTECQYDNRLCQPNTCWNNGTCNEISNTTFICHCASGWEGTQCETIINYCQSSICLNSGVCQSSLLNYTCKCLGESYSGQHCEVTSNKITALKTFSRLFAYIVIIAMISVAIFVGTLDVLKYFFGIGPVSPTHKKPRSKKRKKPISIIRYIYVHAPLQQSSIELIPTVAETTI